MSHSPRLTAAYTNVETQVGHELLGIATADGECPTHVFTPSAGRRWPGVVMYMDAFGMRPALGKMAQRLAEAGYVVLLPDLFYRYGPYEPVDPKVALQGDWRAAVGPLIATTDRRRVVTDSQGFLQYLDSRSDVTGRGAGVVGFCMGGGMALRVSGTYPDQIAAVATFHAGNLATDDELSPHLMATSIEAEVYLAVADRDRTYPPEMAARFEEALETAGVRYRSELYADAAHGWMMPDFPVFNPSAAERGWSALFALFARNIRGELRDE